MCIIAHVYMYVYKCDYYYVAMDYNNDYMHKYMTYFQNVYKQHDLLEN